MIDRFEAVCDSRVPYKQVLVAPELMNNYMPASVKPQVPLLIELDDHTTTAQLFVDDSLMDNRVHIDPVTASNLGFSEEGERHTITLKQATVEQVDEVLVQNTAPVTDDAYQQEPSIRDHLHTQFYNHFLHIGDETAVPEEVAGEQIPFVVTDYTPRRTGDTVAYVTDETTIRVNLVQLEDDKSSSTIDNPKNLPAKPETMQSANLQEQTSTEEQEENDVTYESIGGLHEEIEQVREMVERPLTDPEAFQGVPNPSGVLLYGPPGTGKTMLAQAVANEIDAAFYALSGAEIFDKNYGQSEENLRSLFEEAAQNKPAIIFIDELEALVPPRDELAGSNQVERRVVTQLKTLMDGFGTEEGVLVLGATNHPSEIDDAFLRPGRFDRMIEIGVPDAQERKEIFQIHTRDMNLQFDDDYFDELVEKTTGYTGADISDLCMKANMAMQRRLLNEYPKYTGRQKVSEILKTEDEGYIPEDFDNAIDETKPSLLERFDVDVPHTRWNEIGGYADTKQHLRQHVDGPLKAPELWSDEERSTGILLYGPPGTGKTMLAKAMATESDRVFIGVQATELKSKWVGETERNIRRLFTLAENLEPSILYIDEIEAIAQPRGSTGGDSGVSDAATSQILSEMDGIEDRGDVIVVGSTNANYTPDAPLQQQEVRFGLDPAILRPGRLESHFHIPKPSADERKEIFRIHLDKIEDDTVKLADDIDVEMLSDKTEGISGADIEGICWEAKHIARNKIITDAGGYEAVDADHIEISHAHLEQAVEEYTEAAETTTPGRGMFS